jgi:hypothetical protein
MSVAVQPSTLTQTQLLTPASAANTAAATSAWVDASAYEGDLLFSLSVGAVTGGSVTWTVEDATDGSGTGAATVAFNEGAATQVTTANDPLTQKRTINASKIRGFVRVVGTVVTGPALVSATMFAHPKYV